MTPLSTSAVIGTESPTTHFPNPTEGERKYASQHSVGEGRLSDSPELDPTLGERHEQWLREQYLRDLDTLERIERQRGAEEPCFFAAMGEISRRSQA